MPMKPPLFLASLPLWCALALHTPAHAAPDVSPSLKKMLSGLPIAGIKDQLQSMMAALEKTPCGGGLQGCYATSTGPLQLYFFSSSAAQQTLLLVVDQQMAMPNVLGEKAQKVMGGTALRSPIISISTTDYMLDQVKMPPALQKVVRERYFNVNSLDFAAGVQLAARADLGGPIKLAMEGFGVKGSDLTLRAAVVMPIPTDFASGAGAGAEAADAVAHGETMKKAGTDAAKPEAFIELQFAPNAALPLKMPAITLTDATFFLNNALTFGFKGNATYDGVPGKKILIQFQTPLDPAGAMDLLDFSFRMATPPSFTMEDAAHVMVAMATPDPRLAAYGGGFIRGIAAFKQPLLAATQPLSVFKLQNPTPAPAYRFGDSSAPWPDDPKFFNIVVLGPLADGGPYLRAAGQVNILGQKMGWLDASAGASGLQGTVGEALTLKLGPLGKVSFKMQALANVDKNHQDISLKGNLAGQKVEVTLSGSTMTVAVNASCVNPFEIKVQATIQASTDIAQVFEGQGGVNVDPASIGGCIGKDLEAAYNKIAGEYKNLSGYTAGEANKALKKISDDAVAAYNATKNAARELARQSTSAAKKTFDSVGNGLASAANSASSSVVKASGGKTAKVHMPTEDEAMFDRTVFDWDYYYDTKGTAWGNTDLFEHWKNTGYPSGAQASNEFNLNFYRSHNNNTGKTGKDSLINWVAGGYAVSGPQGSATFSLQAYRNRYPDLKGWRYQDLMNHWLDHGRAEGRDGRP